LCALVDALMLRIVVPIVSAGFRRGFDAEVKGYKGEKTEGSGIGMIIREMEAIDVENEVGEWSC